MKKQNVKILIILFSMFKLIKISIHSNGGSLLHKLLTCIKIQIFQYKFILVLVEEKLIM